MTELSLKFGMAPESSFAYPMFGSLLITYMGTIDSGYRFGVLALENLDDTNFELHCKTLTLANNFILIWKHHLNNSLEPLTQAYRIGMETGEIEFALIAGVTRSTNAFVLGHDLNSLETSLETNNKKAKEFNQAPIVNLGSIYQQAVHNLISQNQDPWKLEGAIYDETIQNNETGVDESSMTNLFILKSFLATLFNQPAHALEFAQQARRTLRSVISSPAVPFFTLYESLACVANLGRVSYIEQLKLRLRLKLNQRQLRKWAHHCPENILHGYHLVEAERAKFLGNTSKAMDHYELAIEYADEHGFLKEQGFANELAGRFYLEQGKRDLALFYLGRSKSIYRRWGATTKVHWMN
jgi:tetratricopeptide (TPR) repeat protein